MVKWKIVYTRQAQRDARKLAASGFKEKAETLLEIPSADPFKSPLRMRNSWEISRALIPAA
jgi:hypothetical protein